MGIVRHAQMNVLAENDLKGGVNERQFGYVRLLNEDLLDQADKLI